MTDLPALPICPDCGGLITEHPGLLRAQHRVRHTEWKRPANPVALIAAYRDLVRAYETDRRRQELALFDLEQRCAIPPTDTPTP